MTEIIVPHWLAEMLIKRHGSLQAAREYYGFKIVDDYWDRLAGETQNKVNETMKPLPEGSGQG